MSPTAPASSRVAGPFSGVSVALMIGIGCLALLTAVGIGAVANNLRGGSMDGGHALSRSAIGFAGLVDLLNDSGVRAKVGREDLGSDRNTEGLLILTPELGSELSLAKAPHHDGPVLIIPPKWIGIADPTRPGWIYDGGLVDPSLVARRVTELSATLGGGSGDSAKNRSDATIRRVAGVQHPVLLAGHALFVTGTRLDFGPVARLQTLGGEGWTPALVDSSGRVVLARAADTDVFVLSDPDLLNNHGLATLRGARSAVALLGALRGGEGPVTFDVTLNGFSRPKSLLSTLLRPPLLPASLCALAAAMLMGFHAAIRFGPATRSARPIAFGKIGLLETSAAVIHRANRAPRMAPRYAALTRGLAARAVGAPVRLSAQELDGLLDGLTASRSGDAPFSVLAERAGAASTARELLAASRALFNWRLAVTHDNR